jgi:catechol 2,3-dioxygenase-like lactoylglutathione lyase family enzyme
MLDAQNRPIPHTPPAPQPPYCPHVALGVEDLDAMLDTLAKADIPLLKGPLAIPGKVRWCYMADPDSNVIEFVQWL